ncbi:collagen-like protein [Salegentibacter sp. BLCTC]|uniref:collagen-like protein n=1 Tax=Salegentibacter sp. BLCTC TaxID=2697368 RepID=UPI00187B3641|nr:collagen-like protein [Salegentibacter sp. BLCTC]MBE7640191.1 collagen-like protein [Salegentibacter sp. BLCTC]
MKKIFPILFMTTFLFAACSSDGERGPQGPEGPQGPPGEALIGTTIEYEGIDFTEENDYSALIEFDDIEVFESDAVLVYLKDGEDGTSDGAPVEVFRQLPQTYYVEDGEVQYNFDFTFFDVRIFMEGTANFSNLDPAYTQDQVIRIVIVPANFAETTGVDVANYKAVMNALDLKESDVKKVSMLK